MSGEGGRLPSADDVKLEEYRLLQGKLDKIGEFRIQVKSWVVALASAIAFVGLTSDVPPIAMFMSPLFVVAFWLLEEYERLWGRAFSRRLAELESDERVPHIARIVRSVGGEARRSWCGRTRLWAHGVF